MTIKELIKELEKYEPDFVVITKDNERGCKIDDIVVGHYASIIDSFWEHHNTKLENNAVQVG